MMALCLDILLTYPTLSTPLFTTGMGATRAGGATTQGPGPAAPQRTERPKPASKPLDNDGPDNGMKAPIMSAPRGPGNQ